MELLEEWTMKHFGYQDADPRLVGRRAHNFRKERDGRFRSQIALEGFVESLNNRDFLCGRMEF